MSHYFAGLQQQIKNEVEEAPRALPGQLKPSIGLSLNPIPSTTAVAAFFADMSHSPQSGKPSEAALSSRVAAPGSQSTRSPRKSASTSSAETPCRSKANPPNRTPPSGGSPIRSVSKPARAAGSTAPATGTDLAGSVAALMGAFR